MHALHPVRFTLLAFAITLAAHVPAAEAIPDQPLAPNGSCVESFEGEFPPPGWYVQRTNATYSWERQTDSPHNGDAAAWVFYDVDPQDERLATPFGSFRDPLVLWTWGNPYWCRDENDDCDLELWYFALGEDPILVTTLDSAWTGLYQWVEVTVDLAAASLPPGLGRLEFRYVGQDADAVTLDDIAFAGGCPLFGSGFELGHPCDWDVIEPPCGLPP